MYAHDHGVIATPVGTIRIQGDDERIWTIGIGEDPGRRTGTAAAVRTALDQLEAWFAGERTYFDIPLAAPATTRGQQLRAGLIAVGYGETLSYGALARRLGSSARAIGQLCARNPFPIVVPCHRIVRTGGALGPYSAGCGPHTKKWLLDHERRFASTGDPT